MSERLSYGSIGFYLGAGTHVTCHTYPDVAPILAVDSNRWSLTISPAEREVITDGDLTNARRLAEAVTTFVADLERLHAASANRSESAESESAA